MCQESFIGSKPKNHLTTQSLPLIKPHGEGLQLYSLKKAALKKFTMFTGKQLCWSLIVIKLRGNTYF